MPTLTPAAARSVVATALITLAPSTLGAAETVTEREFLAPLVGPAGADHPASVARTVDLGQARAASAAAATLPNPELELSREDPSGGTEQIDLTLSWRPPRPGRTRLARKAAGARVKAATAGLAADRLSLRSRAREAFAAWAVAFRRARRLGTRVERLDALAAREASRAESGEASGLEARRLGLATSEVRVELARERAALARARAAAGAWRPDLPAGAEPILPALPPVPALPSAPGPAHPELRALEAELDAARLDRRVAEHVLRPPRLSVGWQQQDAGRETVEGPLLGLSWPLPLTDRSRAERLSAAARAQALEARIEVARRRLDSRRAGTLAAYEGLREAAVQAAAAASDAEPVVEAAAAAFRLGEAGLTELLETLRSALAAELAALGIHADALAAHRELELSTGETLAPLPRTPEDEPLNGDPP